ncbi:MAG: BrnA antitoxin family protein [Methylococcales bacterium]|nr:BrnA antitoxin family protein [Methylococcales bacterium]
MNGSKTNVMTRSEVLAAVRAIPPEKNYVWDGIDEDDRPATSEELQAALMRGRGRPLGSDKTQIALRVDNDILNTFKQTGKGWQTRMNNALKEWLSQHPELSAS